MRITSKTIKLFSPEGRDLIRRRIYTFLEKEYNTGLRGGANSDHIEMCSMYKLVANSKYSLELLCRIIDEMNDYGSQDGWGPEGWEHNSGVEYLE